MNNNNNDIKFFTLPMNVQDLIEDSNYYLDVEAFKKIVSDNLEIGSSYYITVNFRGSPLTIDGVSFDPIEFFL